MSKVNFVSKQISVSVKKVYFLSVRISNLLCATLNKHIVTSNFAQKHLANRPKDFIVKKNKCLDGLLKVFTKTAHTLNILRNA